MRRPLVWRRPARLPEEVRTFWYAACELEERAIRTPWGVVVTDSRYPIIHDANNASVMEPSPTLTLDEIREVLHPPLREAGATFEHVEMWETSVKSPALAAIRRVDPRHRPDVVMVHQGPIPRPAPSPVVVREVADPDEALWAWYSQSRRLFGDEITPQVEELLLARDQAVFHPAGLRWFTGVIDGKPAGYASLLSLAGIGYIDTVVTLPPYRRRGVASICVTAAARASRERGDRALFLLAEENQAPQRLYQRLGFRVRSRIESMTCPLPPL